MAEYFSGKIEETAKLDAETFYIHVGNAALTYDVNEFERYVNSILSLLLLIEERNYFSTQMKQNTIDITFEAMRRMLGEDGIRILLDLHTKALSLGLENVEKNLFQIEDKLYGRLIGAMIRANAHRTFSQPEIES